MRSVKFKVWIVECKVSSVECKVWSVAGGGDLVVLVVMLLCWLVVSLWIVAQVPSLRRYERTMYAKKKFVFPLQRFALVVQEREYIRVRGFHLVFVCMINSLYFVHVGYWLRIGISILNLRAPRLGCGPCHASHRASHGGAMCGSPESRTSVSYCQVHWKIQYSQA